MSLKYVRRRYDVPAKRGAEVEFEGVRATIVGATGGWLRLRLPPGGEHTLQKPQRANVIITHPTYHLDYLDGQGVRV